MLIQEQGLINIDYSSELEISKTAKEEFHKAYVIEIMGMQAAEG